MIPKLFSFLAFRVADMYASALSLSSCFLFGRFVDDELSERWWNHIIVLNIISNVNYPIEFWFWKDFNIRK